MTGDDKLHFELLLKYIYTNNYDTAEIAQLAANDVKQRLLIPMGICVVADKYEVRTAYNHASNDVRALLMEDVGGPDFELIKTAVIEHYEDMSVDEGTAMGKLITSVILQGQRRFTSSADYLGKLKSYPTFAVDIASALAQDTINIRCSCSFALTLRTDMRKKYTGSSIQCNFCGRHFNSPPVKD